MTRPCTQPLISIAICSYNGEQFVAAQLESILSQTWKNLEIIIVDDHSTDSTPLIIQEFTKKDNRIKLFRNAINLGINKNFELCIKKCKGDFIAPCDQDDIWHPQKIEILFTEIKDHALAYCDSELIDTDGKKSGKKISDRLNMYEGESPVAFALWNSVSGHASLFRKDLLFKALPMPNIKYFDWWLAFIACSNGGIKYVNQPLVMYRQHANTQTDILRLKKAPKNDNRLKVFTDRCLWLKTLATVNTKDKLYLQKLSELYCAQSQQYWSPALLLHLYKRKNELFHINKKQKFIKFAIKALWGIKIKYITSKTRYMEK